MPKAGGLIRNLRNPSSIALDSAESPAISTRPHCEARPKRRTIEVRFRFIEQPGSGRHGWQLLFREVCFVLRQNSSADSKFFILRDSAQPAEVNKNELTRLRTKWLSKQNGRTERCCICRLRFTRTQRQSLPKHDIEEFSLREQIILCSCIESDCCKGSGDLRGCDCRY